MEVFWIMNNNIILFTNAKDKGGNVMCKILKNIQNLSAIELLSKYNISTEPPIDIGRLLDNIGIKSFGTNFDTVEKNSGYEQDTILGATIIDGEEVIIFYREKDSMNRKRFTIAHELAHCCNDSDTLKNDHIELRTNEIVLSGKEYDANIFAGELLIPTNSLLHIYNKLLIPSLSVLASIFDVSSNVMAKRLDHLKLPFLKDANIDES